MTSGAAKLVAAGTAFFAVAFSYAQGPAAETPRKWVDSFNAYKSQMRPLGAAATRACEGQLQRILKAVDDNGACTVDSDCTLVNQEPFGRTIPIRMDSARALQANMKQFRDACDNQLSQAFYNSELVHVPACVQGRCMVKTSVKK